MPTTNTCGENFPQSPSKAPGDRCLDSSATRRKIPFLVVFASGRAKFKHVWEDLNCHALSLSSSSSGGLGSLHKKWGLVQLQLTVAQSVMGPHFLIRPTGVTGGDSFSSVNRVPLVSRLAE